MNLYRANFPLKENEFDNSTLLVAESFADVEKKHTQILSIELVCENIEIIN